MSEKVIVERPGAVTQLTLHRENAANAIDTELALAISEAIDAFSADAGARVMAVTGAGNLPWRWRICRNGVRWPIAGVSSRP